ncbi:LOW QUALITY PROTEIN: transcriptional regulator, Ada family/DNA-3-methyladenine glycosylase II, partial [Streptomyces himastatinicus ATCC 53653]
MYTDTDRCLRAARAKDARFDGWFFIAVVTTRIYCRPSCPVVGPKPENMRFYPSAAAAQQAGFRACKRCRPDASPGSPQWNERADLVARAMRLIADGVVDREGVPGLAARLGYSTRQIERQLLAELGAGPLALARAQRAQTARLLIETSGLPMADIAFAAGFASIRAFNETVREVFALSPTELRQRAERGPRPAVPGALTLRLPFRAPLCPDNLFGHLAATAVPGVEEWRDGAYRRTLRLPYGPGVVALAPRPDHIACQLSLADLRDLSGAISRCRRLLDLDADPGRRRRPAAHRPPAATAGRQGAGRRVPRRRTRRVRGTGGTRSAGVHGRGPHPRRPAGDRARRPGHRPGRRAHPPLSDRRGPRRTGPRGAGHAAHPPRHAHRAGRRARRGAGRARRRQRLGRGQGGPRHPVRARALDRRGHRDARPRRPGRVPRHRPRRPQGRRRAGAARHARRPHPARRALAALARVRRPVPLGHRRRPRHQPPARV